MTRTEHLPVEEGYRRALDFYAQEESIEEGIHGHWNEEQERWIPDMGYRAAAAMHGHYPVDEAVLEADVEAEQDDSCRICGAIHAGPCLPGGITP